jgi:hypothetical protein
MLGLLPRCFCGRINRINTPARLPADLPPGMEPVSSTTVAMSHRYAPARPLPPYAYVPGHDLPHPVTDARGHSYATHAQRHEAPIARAALDQLPADPASRHRALAAMLAANAHWRHTLDLFNAGHYWESHEGWEGFWNVLGRTTPEARCIQGLIHLAAAAVKIREGKPAGVSRHTARARELLGGSRAAPRAATPAGPSGGHAAVPGDRVAAVGLAPESIAAVVAELENYKPECWHTCRAPLVRVLASELRPAD